MATFFFFFSTYQRVRIGGFVFCLCLWLFYDCQLYPQPPPSCLSLGFFIIPVSWFRRGTFSALLTLLFFVLLEGRGFLYGIWEFYNFGIPTLVFVLFFCFWAAMGWGKWRGKQL